MNKVRVPVREIRYKDVQYEYEYPGRKNTRHLQFSTWNQYFWDYFEYVPRPLFLSYWKFYINKEKLSKFKFFQKTLKPNSSHTAHIIWNG